jgi:hypothetical protein
MKRIVDLKSLCKHCSKEFDLRTDPWGKWTDPWACEWMPAPDDGPGPCTDGEEAEPRESDTCQPQQ